MIILLVGEDGEKLGQMTIDEAKKIAKDAKKSLILVSAKNNVYRIADEGKLKYEQKQKERNQRAQKRTHKIKEIKLHLTTDQHDVDIKINRIREFLSKGLKTKVSLQLHGRELSFKEMGIEKVKAILLAACEGGLASVDKGPSFEGKNIIAYLNPAKIAK